MKTKENLILILVILTFAIVLSGAVYFVVFLDSPEKTNNEVKMDKICKYYSNGEPYLYKTGWSDVCGFDVYRGTCVKNGLVDKNIDVLLVDGVEFEFDSLPEPNYPKEENFGWDGEAYVIAQNEARDNWQNEVCRMFVKDEPNETEQRRKK